MPAGPRRIRAFAFLAALLAACQGARESGNEGSTSAATAAPPGAPEIPAPSPAMREQFRGLSDREAVAKAVEIGATATPYLPDSLLLERTRLLHRILLSSDDATCGAIVLGRPAPEQLSSAVGLLDSAARARWVQIAIAGFEAKQQRGALPPPPPSPEQMESAFGALLGAMKEADAQRVANVLGQPAAAPPSEACWAARALYGGILAAEPPVRRVLIRGITPQR